MEYSSVPLWFYYMLFLQKSQVLRIFISSDEKSTVKFSKIFAKILSILHKYK